MDTSFLPSLTFKALNSALVVLGVAACGGAADAPTAATASQAPSDTASAVILAAARIPAAAEPASGPASDAAAPETASSSAAASAPAVASVKIAAAATGSRSAVAEAATVAPRAKAPASDSSIAPGASSVLTSTERLAVNDLRSGDGVKTSASTVAALAQPDRGAFYGFREAREEWSRIKAEYKTKADVRDWIAYQKDRKSVV